MTEREMLQALKEAQAHVVRQQFHGKHVQDREDAKAWVAKWKRPLEEKARKSLDNPVHID